MPRDLDRTRRTWERLGATDPMWGVLTHKGMRGRWEAEDFFRHGTWEVDSLMTQFAMAGVDPPRDRVLDFGCGLGRLSFALAEHFEQVVGVDLSRPMLEKAREYNHLGDRCQFFLYDGNDLHLFDDGSFGTVVSLMTLQHVPPERALVYVRELVRVLRPGGILAVQIPSERLRPERSFSERFRHGVHRGIAMVRRSAQMEMHAIAQREVTSALESAGAAIAGVIGDGRAGRWGTSLLYVARRST
ncbi:MAG TPA: methyltransferase domain-containing protein [Acidimicrobiales bacterium]|nr:methyltransferase domain-containing protein [Acidimicrobiales bacterium]